MIWVCRTVFLLVFALFWGGLTFYTGIVVGIMHDVLNDPMDGGLITQRVTVVLQILGVVTVVLMACNAFVVAKKSRKHGHILLTCAFVLGCTLIGLYVVHGHMDNVIDVEAFEITDDEAFAIGHRRYNQLTTVQWLVTLAYIAITVFAWQCSDNEQ